MLDQHNHPLLWVGGWVRADCAADAHIPSVGCTKVGCKTPSYFIKETGVQMGVYCKWQTYKPYRALEMGFYALPSCTLVTDQYNPSISGAINDPV